MAQSKAAKSLERVFRLTVNMGEPLRDAMDCATARRLFGRGLAARDDMEPGNNSHRTGGLRTARRTSEALGQDAQGGTPIVAMSPCPEPISKPSKRSTRCHSFTPS
jgi:hypothetical protein